jgi:hypothetical protein
MHDDSISAVRARTPLRIVLLLDSLRVPRWIAEIIADMKGSSALDVVAVVLNDRAPAQRGDGARRPALERLRNGWRHRHNVLLNCYMKADGSRYPASGLDPFDTVDVTTALDGIRQIQVVPRQTAYSDYFEEDAIKALRSVSPDVGVRFGFRILRGAVLTVPRYGIWSFHHGDNRVNRGGPAGFWEVMYNWRDTGALLQQLSEQLDGGPVLARTSCVTNHVSVHQNRVQLFRSTAPLLMRKLLDLFSRGEVALTPLPTESAYLPFSNRLYLFPSVGQILAGAFRILRRALRAKFRELRSWEQWRLEYTFSAAAAGSTDKATVPQAVMYRMKPLTPPGDRIWADPFPVIHESKHFVFFEELLLGKPHASIAVAELSSRDGFVGEPRTVLSPPYHVSYPFVFEHGDSWYMMPEMAEHGQQELFKATEFPLMWEHDRVLDLGQPVVDATLLHHDARWWLFGGTSARADGPFNELSIWYGESPLGPWTAHPANPVVSDVRSARPAGHFFRIGGELIRPSQDCTPEYGTAVVLNRVLRLDTEGYVEEHSGRISPDWSPEVRGTHTLNAAGALTIVDTRVVRPR